MEKFLSLAGSAKIAFFRENKEELKAAAILEHSPAATKPAVTKPSATAPTPLANESRRPGNLQAVDTAPEELLSKFYGLSGKEKTAFFRANKAVLKAAEAVVAKREAATARASASHDQEATALRNYAFAARAAAQGGWVPTNVLLEQFQALSGEERTSFFRANRAALMLAAA